MFVGRHRQRLASEDGGHVVVRRCQSLHATSSREMRNKRHVVVFAALSFVVSLPLACAVDGNETHGGEGGAAGAGGEDEADPFTARCRRLFKLAKPALGECLDEA